MKKIMVNGLLVMCLIAFSAIPTMAAQGAYDVWQEAAVTSDPMIPDTTGAGLTGLKFSANVYFIYVDDPTGNSFALATWNEKGTKVYASNALSSKIYRSVNDITTSGSLIAPAVSGAWASATWAEVGN